MVFGFAIGLPVLLVRAVHHVGHALSSMSIIAASSAAVDVVRDSVEQTPLCRRTTHSQLPAMCAVGSWTCSARQRRPVILVAGSIDGGWMSPSN
jgi:hypothetical protein